MPSDTARACSGQRMARVQRHAATAAAVRSSRDSPEQNGKAQSECERVSPCVMSVPLSSKIADFA
eukprot:3142030-Rhodomonas_salina.3